MDESFADATGARTVMYTAPQYRFSFVGSIMKSENEKTSSFGKVQFEYFHVSFYPGAKEFQQNKRRRRTTNTGSEEGGLQIFG